MFKFENKKVPCKNCKGKHLGCHSDCKAYIKYAENQKEIREKAATFYDYRKNAVGKYNKWLKNG